MVPFVDVGTSGGLHYLAWPLVEGESMDKVVEREGKFAPDIAAAYALQVANGLSSCHQHGIFHGLLKPSNLLLGSDGQVHILDLGIGALLSENEGESLVDTMSTANTMTSGLDCSSPESIMEPTNRTPAGDQYSIGCCLYYFMTGRYPFPDGSAVEKMMAHQYKQPTPVKELCPECPDELVEVVDRLMQKTPEARYSSSEEVVEALRPVAAQTTPAPAVSRPAGRGAAATLPGAAAPIMAWWRLLLLARRPDRTPRPPPQRNALAQDVARPRPCPHAAPCATASIPRRRHRRRNASCLPRTMRNTRSPKTAPPKTKKKTRTKNTTRKTARSAGSSLPWPRW